MKMMIIDAPITIISDLLDHVAREEKILCLYSGGLDGAYLIHELYRLGFRDILALTLDLGQPLHEQHVQEIAERLGSRWLSVDAKNEFVMNYVFPAIYCHATYLNGHPISASLSRPLMAQRAVQVAQDNNCRCILHTASISQNSLRRFNSAIRLLHYDGAFGSPFALSAISRLDKIKQLGKAGIIWSEDKHYSVDENLWIHELEYGNCDNPEEIIIPQELLKWTLETAFTPAELTIHFENGIPTGLNDEAMNGPDLIRKLNTFVGTYGLGRYIWLEELSDGRKVQEIREAPAALILFDAYRRLESAVLSSEQIREKFHIEQLWVREASEGRWFGNLRPACQAFCNELAKLVTGNVTYKLAPREMQPKRIKAEQPSYIVDREIYEKNVANKTGQPTS
jgi:argininosuccinate synthase